MLRSSDWKSSDRLGDCDEMSGRCQVEDVSDYVVKVIGCRDGVHSLLTERVSLQRGYLFLTLTVVTGKGPFRTRDWWPNIRA